MDRSQYRRYLYVCARRRLRDAETSGLEYPEAVRSVIGYLRGMYALEIDEWALLAVALFASTDRAAGAEAPGGL